MALYVQLEVGLKFGIGTNNDGTIWGGILLLEISKDESPLANFNNQSIDITFSESSGNGYMVAGETYAWLAW